MKKLLLSLICFASASLSCFATWAVTDLHDFTGTDGSNPVSPCSLTRGSDGNTYYGVVYSGGAYSKGTLYKIVPTTGTPPATFTKLYDFGTVTNDGAYPVGSMVADTSGNYYGVTLSGGAYNKGAIFEFVPSTGAVTVIYSFGSITNDGMAPSAGLTVDNSGGSTVFYGTTSQGGTSTYGTIFKLSYSGSAWSEAFVYSFPSNGTQGIGPGEALVLATDGKLYGTNQGGGAHSWGIAFQFTPGTQTLVNIYDYPVGCAQAGLIQAPGTPLRFIGTTELGGTHSKGNIYTLTKGSGNTFTYQSVHDFAGGSLDGSYPSGDLLYSDVLNGGSFTGVTAGGGSSSNGTIYNVTDLDWALTLENANIGNNTPSSLIWGPDDWEPDVLGVSQWSGANNYGYIWCGIAP